MPYATRCASSGSTSPSARIGRVVDLELAARRPRGGAGAGTAHVLRASGQPAHRELRDPIRGRVTDRPLVAVVVFPGSNDDHDAAWALGAVGAEPVLVWHQDAELPAGRRSSGAPRRILVRRLPPYRRDRERLARDGRRPRLRRGRRARPRDLQRVPDPLRGAAPPRRAPREQAARVRVPRRHAPRREHGCRRSWVAARSGRSS